MLARKFLLGSVFLLIACGPPRMRFEPLDSGSDATATQDRVVPTDTPRPDVVGPDVVVADVAMDAPRDVVSSDTRTDAAQDTTPPRDVTARESGGPCTPVVVINEVQTAGAAGAGDEFVELHNAADCPAPLSGWTLRYTSSTGTTPSMQWTGGSRDEIPARGFFVLSGPDFTGTSQGSWMGSMSGLLAGAAGGIGIYAPSNMRVDSVGYGTTARNPLVEATPSPAPDSGESIARSPDGADTDDNRADFRVVTSPTPGATNR